MAYTTLYFNVNGYTLDRDFQLQRFSAIQFTDDRIDAIYGDSDPLAQEPDHRIDGNGQTMIPGLIDAHGHVLSYGLSLLRVDLVGAESESEAAGRVLGAVSSRAAVAGCCSLWPLLGVVHDRRSREQSMDAASYLRHCAGYGRSAGCLELPKRASDRDSRTDAVDARPPPARQFD